MRLVALFPLAALLASCTSAPRPETEPGASIRTTRITGSSGSSAITTTTTPSSSVTEVVAPMDRTWAVLRAVYDSLGIPVSTVDEAQRLMGNSGYKLRRKLGTTSLSRYLDCGAAQGGPNAETYEVFLAVATQLQPAATAGRITATTAVEASARPVSFAGEYVACSSKGALEARIGEMLTLMLAG